MDYLMKQIEKCREHLSEATQKKDLDMVIFWGAAIVGFMKRARWIMDSGALLQEETRC